MATMKHKTSKNASYNDVLEYYMYRHTEDEKTGHYEPILDEDGLPELRDNFAVACLDPFENDADPYEWAGRCMSVNFRFNKNNEFDDVKSHEYIISHPASDRSKMTMEALLDEGKAFAREFFEGYDVLMVVHRDTDNDHIHITINSVRARERTEKAWMKRNEYGEILRSEYVAGGKHQDSPQLKRAQFDWIKEYSREHGLEEKDNNAISDKRKMEREAERTAKNEVRIPKKQREILDALLETLPKCATFEALSAMLKDQYSITIFRRGETISLQHSSAKKAVRLRTLGMSRDDFWERLGNPDAQPFTPDRAFEEKKNAMWIKERRDRNNERAYQTRRQAERAVAANVQSFSGKYSMEDYRELHHQIQKTTYVERDLLTEKEKLERVISRWENARSKDGADRDKDHRFIQWCGYDPDNDMELQTLVLLDEAIDNQIAEIVAIRDTMIETAAKWKDAGLSKYTDMAWSIENERSLKKQVDTVHANRIKMAKISSACYKAAERRLGDSQYLAKAAYFEKLWQEKISEEKVLKSQLSEMRAEKRKTKKSVRSVVATPDL